MSTTEMRVVKEALLLAWMSGWMGKNPKNAKADTEAIFKKMMMEINQSINQIRRVNK